MGVKGLMLKKISFVFLILVIIFLLCRVYALHTRVELYEREIRELRNRLQKVEKILKTSKRVIFVATAYTSSPNECDSTPFITASGQKVRWGIVAADRRYPFGTKIYFPFFRQVFEVQDRGGAIKGNRIDIWFPDKKEALKFGVKKLVGYILGGNSNFTD